MFERHAPAIAAFFLALLTQALTFGAVVLQGGSPVKPEFYGPLVYEIPALVWAGTQVAFAVLAAAGAIWRKPVMGAIGAALMAVLLLFFGTAAIAAGASGTLLVTMALPASAIALVCAWIMWRGRNGDRQ